MFGSLTRRKMGEGYEGLGGSRGATRGGGLLDADDKYRRVDGGAVPWWWPACVIAACAVLYLFVHFTYQSLPEPVTIQQSKLNPSIFSAERSRNINRKLASLGPKVVGNIANELSAPNIILKELDTIIKDSSSVQSILVDRQKGNGSYLLNYTPPAYNVYINIQNIIVLVEGHSGENSILVNCHYDSVPDSPGASDDGISCATMLEIIRILSLSSVRLKHNIVFLFNGAEETHLQGSHMFLKHKWSKKCRIVLNLEAAGVGGRNILFQSGPHNPWLLKYYAKYAPHPHGQIVGEELFQNGAIPSDTDFRIFRDFGKLPGLDFAFWHNGYTYHTKFDAEKYIPLGSYQHIGDNTLAMVKALGDAPEIEDMKKHAQGQMVYYDVLSWCMIRYSSVTNVVLNVLAILLAIISIMVFIRRPNQWFITNEVVYGLIKMTFAIFASIFTNIVIGLFLDSFAPLAMAWYSNPWLILFLYFIPCLVAYAYVPQYVDSKRKQQVKLRLVTKVQSDLIAYQVLWILALFLMTIANLRSSSVLFPLVLSSAVANLVIHLTMLHCNGYRWIWAYLAIHIPVLMYNMYMVLMFYMFIIPIFGRAGNVNGDLIVGVLTVVLMLFMFHFMIPLFGLVKKQKLTIVSLLICSLFALLLVLFTGVGHPYSSAEHDPKPQRYIIFHSHRLMKDAVLKISDQSTGYAVYNLDRNSPHTMPIDKELIQQVWHICQYELYCGMPLYTSRLSATNKKSNWIPSGRPYIPFDTELIVENNHPKCDEFSQCQISALIQGPNRIALAISPRDGVSVVDWTLSTEIRSTDEWNGRPVYFVQIASADEKIDMPIALTLNVTDKASDPEGRIIDIALSGNYIDDRKIRTGEFQEVLNRMPEWTHVTAWINAHRLYAY